jgi:DNA-binding transcriptional LysR family regulator
VQSLSDIDVNLLTALGALLEERSLTRAGERIHMTQSTMSGALARLRKMLGDELLVREGRGYILSPLAECLLPDVQQALAQAERTLHAFRTFDPLTATRTFTISISDYALTILTKPLLRQLSELAPRVSIDFDPLPLPAVGMESHLQRRDLVIAATRTGIPGEREAIFSDRFVCIVSSANTSVHGPEITLDQLATLPYAAGSLGDGTSTPADTALARIGLEPQVAIRVNGLLSLPFLVSGTDLVAFVPERLADSCAADLGLRTVATPVQINPLVESAHWHPMSAREAGLRWLRGVLGQVSEDLGRQRPTEAAEPVPPTAATE